MGELLIWIVLALVAAGGVLLLANVSAADPTSSTVEERTLAGVYGEVRRFLARVLRPGARPAASAASDTPRPTSRGDVREPSGSSAQPSAVTPARPWSAGSAPAAQPVAPPRRRGTGASWSAPVETSIDEFFASVTVEGPAYVQAEEIIDVVSRARDRAVRSVRPASTVQGRPAPGSDAERS